MIYYTMEDREEALERAKHSKEFIFIPAVGDPKPWKYWTPEERRREAAPNKNDAMKREETQISENFQRGENLRKETESDILNEMQEKRKIGGSFSFREYFRRIQQARNRQKA